jgi:hypothetical protein
VVERPLAHGAAATAAAAGAPAGWLPGGSAAAGTKALRGGARSPAALLPAAASAELQELQLPPLDDWPGTRREPPPHSAATWQQLLCGDWQAFEALQWAALLLLL